MAESESSRRYREEMEAKWGDDSDSSPEQKKKQAREASDKYKNWAKSSEKAEYELSLENAKVAAKLGMERPQQKAISVTGKEDGVMIDGLMYTAIYWSDGSTSYKKM